MRQIVLDTETTGLDWRNGDRVIEIGCVELLNRRLSGRHFHVYLNPDRGIDAEAAAVHGISEEFLADKPRFADVGDEFADFVRDAELIIHNASFDVGFLNNELALAGMDALEQCCAGVIDTLKMAKEQNPGKRASLDALCERFEIDNTHRQLHGALLDAELLAEVYLAMTRGQESLMMLLEDDGVRPGAAAEDGAQEQWEVKVMRATEAELEAHRHYLATMAQDGKRPCLWQALEADG